MFEKQYELAVCGGGNDRRGRGHCGGNRDET